MNLNEICVSRTIPHTDIETPILVPAFSSAVFGICDKKRMHVIGDIYKFYKKRLKNASLLSAFDIYYNYIDINEIQNTKILFLDSGIYEKDCYTKAGRRVKWSYEKYLEALNRVKPTSLCVLVNYDRENKIKDQLAEADNFFNEYPDCIRNFLYKPRKKDRFIDIDELVKNVNDIEKFDILGIAEKELGPSPLKRCENLLKIRIALNSIDSVKPIHVFGCLDFLSVLSFYCCGADIFDGLSWLRYGLYEKTSIYINNYALIEGLWGENMGDIHNIAYLRNLSYLETLTKSLKEFSSAYDFGVFNLREDIINQLKLLINYAGIDMRV